MQSMIQKGPKYLMVSSFILPQIYKMVFT